MNEYGFDPVHEHTPETGYVTHGAPMERGNSGHIGGYKHGDPLDRRPLGHIACYKHGAPLERGTAVIQIRPATKDS